MTTNVVYAARQLIVDKDGKCYSFKDIDTFNVTFRDKDGNITTVSIKELTEQY